MLNYIKIFTVLLCGLSAVSASASTKNASVPDLRDDSASRPVYRPSPQELSERTLAAFVASTAPDELDRLQRLIREGLAAKERAREEERRKAIVDRFNAH